MKNDMAFPVLDRTQTPNDTIQLGLTKREYFAAAAMQGLLAGKFSPPYTMDDRRTVGTEAMRHADSLIYALSKSEQDSSR